MKIMSKVTHTSTKRFASTVSVSVLSLMSVSAHAFLVDKTEQKTVYIGKGDNLTAMQVQQIKDTLPMAGATISQTYNYANTGTSTSASTQNNTRQNDSYNQGYTTTQITTKPLPAGTVVATTNPTEPFPIQTNYGNYSNYGTSQYNTAQYGDQLAISTRSAAAMVFDLQTGQPIYQKNVDAIRSIASISKVMTAMVLMDAGLDMREEIVLEASDFNGAKKASSNLRVGDRMSRSEFILLMLMKSENPAAKALARTYPGGYDNFIWQMNQKAQSLGMYSTSYADASGLDPRNRSTANDLVKMMRTVNADPRYQTVRNFSTAPSYDFYINNYISGSRIYKANNTSRLVREGAYPIGASKTGFTRDAGYCYVMETHVNNRPAVVVLLGASASESRWNDAGDILTQLAYRY